MRHYVPRQAVRDVSLLDTRRFVKDFGNTFSTESMKKFHILDLRSGDLGGCNSALCVASIGRSVSHREGEIPCAELDTGTVAVQ